MKKRNYFSKDYFGSHISRFNYDLPKLVDPSPLSYSPKNISDKKSKNIYFKCDKERDSIFKTNRNPAPNHYYIEQDSQFSKGHHKKDSLISDTICRANALKDSMDHLYKENQQMNKPNAKNLILSNEETYKKQKELLLSLIHM